VRPLHEDISDRCIRFYWQSVLIQPLTGFWLLAIANWSLTDHWLFISVGLYLFAGLCWLPVVYLQIKMSNMSDQALQQGTHLPVQYRHYARIWFLLGILAFIAMIIIVYLMTTKGALL
jgi:uncharacterized membrane protein